MSRGRAVRFPAAGQIPEPPEPVGVLGPVVFTVVFGGTARTVDFSDAPCPRLVRPLAAELAGIGGDDGVVHRWRPDFQQMTRHLRAFAEYTASQAAAPDRFGLADLGPRTLDGFEAGLLARYGQSGSQVQAFMSTVVRLLRLAAGTDPVALTPALQGRLGYGTTLPARRSRPLDAYPVTVLEAIEQAAAADVRALRDRLDAGTAPAAGGTASAAGGTGPDAGAGRRGESRAEVLLTPADLVPLLVALICRTGLEPECAKTLRAGCLSSPSGGFLTVAYEKKRAHTGTAKTIRVGDGGLSTPGGLIRLALRLTAPARASAGTGALWVGAGQTGVRAFFDTGYEMTGPLRAWAGRHRLQELTDYGGGPVRLDLRRLRKSVKSRLYLRSGGVLEEFTAGHTRQVAASRYADIGAHRELHEQAVEAGLRQALDVALPPPVVATCTGAALPGPATATDTAALTPAQARAAVSAEQDVFLASCTGFHDSPYARTPGVPCPVAVWGCLECPNAVFTQRHLPSLVSFAGFLDAQREQLPAERWRARYGLAHERLTGGIFPAFTPAQLGQARAEATAGDRTGLPALLLASLT